MQTPIWSSTAVLLLCTTLASAANLQPSSASLDRSFITSSNFTRSPGRCAIRDSCGKKSVFSGDIPCPDNGKAVSHRDDAVFTATLKQVCGDDFDPSATCCTLGQLETLSSSLSQADPLISSCPACRINFRQFYCHFTCSPDQSQFLTVTSTQILKKDGKEREAVKSVEFSVSEEYGKGFFDSCKGVKFGATNGYAMDLIGGGATDYLSFLRYMGTERSLGSPFQIDFPAPPSSSSPSTNSSLSPPVPLDISSYSCSSSDPAIRCACPDCEEVCAELPPILSPREREARRCRVGKMDCFPFVLVILYAIVLLSSIVFLIGRELQSRYATGGIRLPDIALEEDVDVDSRSRESGRGGDAGGDDLGPFTRLRNRLSFINQWWKRSKTRQKILEISEDFSPASAVPPSPDVGDPLAEDQEYDETPVPLSSSAAMRAGKSRNRSSTQGSSPSSGDSSRSRRNGRGHRANGSTPSTSSQHRLSLSVDPSFDSAIPAQPRTYPLNTILSRTFYSLGFFCAKRPLVTIFLGITISGLLNIGWKKFEVEKDPVRLWVPKGSPVAREKAIFEENFGPFYRTEQLFFSLAPPSSRSAVDDSDGTNLEINAWNPIDSPVLTSFDTLSYILSIENHIRTLTTPRSGISLPQVCFAPSASSSESASLEDCIVQSPLAYFQHSLEDAGVNEKNWRTQLDACADSPASCLPTFGQPIEPKFVFGKIPVEGEDRGKASQARAIVVTYVVRNSLDKEEIARAEEWELEVERYLKEISKRGGEANQRGLRIDWSTGRSLEEELGASANTDVAIVVLSYLLMFLYIAFGLGPSGFGIMRLAGRGIKRGVSKGLRRLKNRGAIELNSGGNQDFGFDGDGESGSDLRRKLLVESKVGLAIFAILLVLLSISTSVAFLSLLGVRTTLIIAEVLPFLVLAIGVDNVFLLTYELESQNALASRQRSLGEDDDYTDESPPVEERVAKALQRMGPSILLSASCEIVAFALGASVGMPAVQNFAVYAAVATLVNALLQVTVFVSALALDQRRIEANRLDIFPLITLRSTPQPLSDTATEDPLLQRFMRTFYAPTLMRKPVKFLVVALFGGLFVLSWIGARHIDLGLDQRLALPSSSYLVNYFNALDEYLEIGPPVYFVLRHDRKLDITSTENVEKVCGRFSACDEYSVANVLEAERKRTPSSFLAEPPAIWIDDFVQWMNPLLEDCCRVKKRNSTEFCGPNVPSGLCKPCFEDHEPPWSTTLEGFPQGEEFMRYLNQWLISPTDESCPLGGRSSYSAALSLRNDRSNVEFSHVRTYHSPLKNQRDFVEALDAAKRIASDLSRRTGTEVFPYSVFYVFFSSYATLWTTTLWVLALTLVSIGSVAAVVLGSVRTAAVVTLTIFLSTVSLLGLMGVWNIALNPLSLVNLVIGAGISVEFCSHIARSFMGVNGGLSDRDERAFAAIVNVGPSVLSGIFLTKIIGIVTLGFTRSRLLEVFYFRMWLGLILTGALHGLVFLPVALSLWGGTGYSLSKEEGDASWISSSLERRYERENSRYRDDESDEDDL
ncbi:sphingolipid transporter [Sporobolomyces salmoneus]|uniref:sphingolipid transporter n=1 Tax=Sporobolomyces salmoneus TaxID=183962 RepID=UPI00316AFA9C